MKVVDNRGLNCPEPVINTKKALDQLLEGTLISITDNDVARENVLKFARSQGCVAESTEEGGVYKITITKGSKGSTPEPQSSPLPGQDVAAVPTLYLIGSEELGRGDSQLGQALMKTFIYSLAESGETGAELIFLNSGVRLTCSDSPVLESLKRLEEKCWNIQSCGTCLDFYGLKEQLAIGEITNMYSIVELMGKCKVVGV